MKKQTTWLKHGKRIWTDISLKKYTNSQQAHEKLLNITSYQRNATQNHNKISCPLRMAIEVQGIQGESPPPNLGFPASPSRSWCGIWHGSMAWAEWSPPNIDHKPLLYERLPAYNLETRKDNFVSAYRVRLHLHNAPITIPPPPPYPYLLKGLLTHHPRVTTYTIEMSSCILPLPLMSLATGWSEDPSFWGSRSPPGHLLGHCLVPLWVHMLFFL